jgi:hypothetical protein
MPDMTECSSSASPAADSQRNNVLASFTARRNSPFAASATVRLAVVAVLLAVLWLAVLWAIV